MKRRFTISSIFLATTLAAVFVAIIGIGAPAHAGPDLVDELPVTHDTLVAADMTRMQDSPLYDQGFDILADQPGAGGFLKRLDDDFDIDPRRDLETIVMTSDTPPLSPTMLEQPTGAMEPGQTAGSNEGALMLIRGDLDAPAIVANIADAPDAESPPTYGRSDGFEVRVLDDRTVAVYVGAADYLDRIRATFDETPAGAGKRFRDGFEKLGTSQGLYLMMEPTIDDEDQFRREVGATASFAGLSVDLGDRVRLGTVATLDDEESATETVEEIDEMRQQASSHPMINLLGVGPLLENMSIQQDGHDVVIRSALTNQQAQRLVGQLKSILETEQELQQPLEGQRLETESDDNDKDEVSEDDGEEDDATTDDGVDADFN